MARRKATKSAATPPARRTRQTAESSEQIPVVYNEMLAEAYAANPSDFETTVRPSKRRKVSAESEVSALQKVEVSKSVSPLPEQIAEPIVFDDFEDSDESEIEFEDVVIAEQPDDSSAHVLDQSRALQLDLSKNTTEAPKRTPVKHRPITKAERAFRLDVHKWHLLCLLLHVAYRNSWCNNTQVQQTLKPLVSRKTTRLLHMNESKMQSERNFGFNKAMEDLCGVWRLHWKINAQGMRRATWREQFDMDKEIDDADDPIDMNDFKDAATECVGSRDVGAQLFCALLRSVAVDARLVCSLQVLPFSGVAKGETPQKATPNYIRASAQDYGSSSHSEANAQLTRKKKKRIVDSPYPVFWVEVFNPALDQWIPVDPVVRHTINKPRTGFEPPASDVLNSLTYAVAFEDDGSAKDVTQRYTTWYNAKTRKSRVESTKDGERWWKKVMQYFQKPFLEPKDAIEDASLLKKLASEGMPKNVQDFKDHPVFVLERHLRMNEVIEPKREVGKVSTGVGKNVKMENVYRRQDVHLCRSADAWYRRGRDVRQGEQPLKRIVSKSHRNAQHDSQENKSGDEAEDASLPLYSESQTDVYIPPPVVDGRIPRNAYGNLDVYVQSMIPAGAVHVKHPFASQAAKILGVSHVNAVTGFQFKGRQGTAIIDGVVVDERYTAAMIATVHGLDEQMREDVNEERAMIILNLWKRMITTLRVRARIQEEYGELEDQRGDDDEGDDSTYEEEHDGGFLPDALEANQDTKAEEALKLTNLKDRLPTTLPKQVESIAVVISMSPHTTVNRTLRSDPTQDLFGSEDEDHEAEGGRGEFAREASEDVAAGATYTTGMQFDGSGGFIPEIENQGGGFVVEDTGDSVNMLAERHQMPNSSGTTELTQPEETAKDAAPQLQQTNPNAENLATFNDSESAHLEIQSNNKPLESEGTIDEGPEDSLSQSSLLSHDPDEDEMEPQWLNEVFDSD